MLFIYYKKLLSVIFFSLFIFCFPLFSFASRLQLAVTITSFKMPTLAALAPYRGTRDPQSAEFNLLANYYDSDWNLTGGRIVLVEKDNGAVIKTSSFHCVGVYCNSSDKPKPF